MRGYIFLFLIAANVLCYTAQAQNNSNKSYATPQQKLQGLFNPNHKQVLVCAHRGDWRNYPENSLAGLKSCVAMGVDIVELDLKRTKDGRLIVMHDKLLDRSTNGKGKPADFTLAEIRQFRLRNGMGRATVHPIPTFEEMLIAAKDRVIINVDKGYSYFNEVIAMVSKHDMLDQVIINIDDNTYLDSVEHRFAKVDPVVVLMPVINYANKNSQGIIRSYLRHQKTIIQPVFNVDTCKLIDKQVQLKNKKYGMWLNSLWASLNGGHDDDTAVDLNKPDQSWGWLIDKGANVIQTDRPLQLIQYLRKRKLHP